MWRYVTRRLAGIIPLMLLISVACFALMHAVPGGPTGVLGENPKASPEDHGCMVTSGRKTLYEPAKGDLVRWRFVTGRI